MQKYVFIHFSMKLFTIALFKEPENAIVTVQLLKSSDRPDRADIIIVKR